tara:strand:+ start:35634 stop:36812 length:1179 start_codon:yes stop_codon:yes gene_type:complete
MNLESGFYLQGPRFLERLTKINWLFILLICCPACIGFLMLYSAAGGSMDPWAKAQIIRFGIGFFVMVAIALIDIRIILRFSYWGYALSLLLLLAVEILGSSAMGAQRWIAIGNFHLQPSELMKIGLILGLARYFSGITHENMSKIRVYIIPIILILLPVGLVLRQPDLGTAVLLVLIGLAIVFLAGIRLWKMLLCLGFLVGAVPIAWQFLREYQKVRVLNFINPESDSLGAGYHILQSKIALGSGGVFGKGLMEGSQSHLNFLPEKQTDFIFTMLAEELGLAGALGVILLYLLIIGYGTFISWRSNITFGRLLSIGVIVTFFLYAFVNISMVMGLLPVVGVPLPLISYGGSAMLTLMVGFGFVLNVWINRDIKSIKRQGYFPVLNMLDSKKS